MPNMAKKRQKTEAERRAAAKKRNKKVAKKVSRAKTVLKNG